MKARLESRSYTQVRSHVIIEDVAADVLKYRISQVFVDASHPFENADLRAAIGQALRELPEKGRFRCVVVEVPFGRPVEYKRPDGTKDKSKRLGTEKEEMLGNCRAHYQRRLMRTPKRFQDAIWQDKRYRYEKNSDKPMKEDDHHPDSMMLALRRWPLGKQALSIPDESKSKQRSRPFTGGLLDEQF